MDEPTSAQRRLICHVASVLTRANMAAWLFGGWGLDARLGRVTRSHGDVEFWIERTDADRAKAVLVDTGSAVVDGQPPEESCEFARSGVRFSTAYDDEPGLFGGTQVLVMSPAGMLAMKEQYPTLRNGKPWRDKDLADIKVLRRLCRDC